MGSKAVGTVLQKRGCEEKERIGPRGLAALPLTFHAVNPRQNPHTWLQLGLCLPDADCAGKRAGEVLEERRGA